MTIVIEQPRLLVVEGKEDELFFRALIAHLNLQDFQILPIGGKNNLRNKLKALAKTTGFSKVLSLGIVRDADSNPNAAFQSVCDALKAAGLPTPGRALQRVGDKPCVTVLVLPGEDKQGTLEDLCLEAVSKCPAMTCVDHYFECLKKNSLLCRTTNMSKAKVQVFLASKPKAGLRLGEAALAGYWPWDQDIFEPLKEFLRQMAS